MRDGIVEGTWRVRRLAALPEIERLKKIVDHGRAIPLEMVPTQLVPIDVDLQRLNGEMREQLIPHIGRRSRAWGRLRRQLNALRPKSHSSSQVPSNGLRRLAPSYCRVLRPATAKIYVFVFPAGCFIRLLHFYLRREVIDGPGRTGTLRRLRTRISTHDGRRLPGPGRLLRELRSGRESVAFRQTTSRTGRRLWLLRWVQSMQGPSYVGRFGPLSSPSLDAGRDRRNGHRLGLKELK